MSELWYRFNVFAEKQFFEETSLVDGLIVPAHVIAYYEVSFPDFLRENNLPFLIDPVSYVWDIDNNFIFNDNGELKKSYSKLVEKLNCRVGNLLGKQRIRDATINTSDFQEFVNQILSFQLLYAGTLKIPRIQSIERLKERIKLIQGEANAEPEKKQVHPYALIPPYFFFRNTLENAYIKTLEAAQFAKTSDYGQKHKIFPCLCMDRSLLVDEGQLNRILHDFKDYPGIIIWISNFDETSASIDELNGFAKFVYRLSRQGREVVNFYGGYFSLLLKYVGLSKVSSGICYSSSRNVFSEASGGGLPVRYYEPTLKIKIMREAMFKLYFEKPELFICDCPICSAFMGQCQETIPETDRERNQLLNQFFIEDKKKGITCVIDWETSRLHFLHSRKMEQKSLEKDSMSKTVNEIAAKYDQLLQSDVDPIKYDFKSLEHLSFWADALKPFIK